MKFFSKVLKNRMSELGIRAIDVHRATGISTGLISNYLHEVHTPGGEHLMLIAKCLKMSLDELIKRSEGIIVEESPHKYNIPDLSPSMANIGDKSSLTMLKWLTLYLELRPTDISKATGASTSLVSKWLKGDSQPTTKYLAPLAKTLNVPPRWIIENYKKSYSPKEGFPTDNLDRLSENIEEVEYDSQASPSREVPVLPWDDILKWDSANKKDAYLKNRYKTLPCMYEDKYSDLTFATEILDNSMSAPRPPNFIPGGYIFCDPRVKSVKSKRPILAKLTDSEVLVFANYIEHAGRKFLSFLNPDFSPIKDEPFEIIGPIIGMWVPPELYY